jgi:hypothetical protein
MAYFPSLKIIAAAKVIESNINYKDEHIPYEVKELLNKFNDTGVDLSDINSLDRAIESNYFDLVKYFVKYLSKYDITSSLDLAIERNNFNIVKYLITNGNVNLQKALYSAINYGNFNIVKYLVEECNVAITNRMTEMAYEISHNDIEDYLRRKMRESQQSGGKSKPKKKFKNPIDGLIWATENDDCKSARYFLDLWLKM